MAQERSIASTRVVENSTLVRVGCDAVSGSRFASFVGKSPSLLAKLRSRIDAARRASRAVRAIRETATTTAAAYRGSILGTSLDTLETWVRGSFCYRWLTAESDPDVVVIDLRDTLTVGPIIALLDRTVRAVAPAVHRSRVTAGALRARQSILGAPLRALGTVVLVAVLVNLLATLALGNLTASGVVYRGIVLIFAFLGVRSTRSWAELRDARAVELLVAALEPPEPPDDAAWDRPGDRTDEDSRGEER